MIEYLKSILENEDVLKSVIREELQEVRETFATPRRTVILDNDPSSIDIEDLIPDEDVVITLSQRGYMKRVPLSNYQQQKRGGKGIAGVQTSDGDFIHTFLTTTNHQYLLLFSNLGKMYQIKAHQVPEGSRYAKGAHIANILPLDKNENIAAAMSMREFSEDKYFLFVTKKGMIKRSSVPLYSNCRVSGIRAVSLKPEDELITVRKVSDDADILLVTQLGTSIRFNCKDVRSMGRVATGVKGIALRGKDRVVNGVVIEGGDREQLLTVSAGGYGKRTPISQYRTQSRGGKGIINMRVTPKTGEVMGAIMVNEHDEIIILTSENKVIRMSVSEISLVGRATQGVRLVKMDENAKVAGFDMVLETKIIETETE